MYGTPSKHIELAQGGEVTVVDAGVRRTIAEDEEGLDISEQFAVAWSDPEEETQAVPMAVPAPPPKKEGVLARALKAAKEKLSRQTKVAEKDAERHVKEVKKEAKDVSKAIADVQDKLKDLEKACAAGPAKGGRSSRVNRKTRRSKGKRRYTKRR